MKRFWLSIMAALLVVAVAAPAMAWEFSMTGEFEYRLRYFGRTGPKDIFGDSNLQNVFNGVQSDSGGYYGTTIGANQSNWIGFAGPNFYESGWSPGLGSAAAAPLPAYGLANPTITDNAITSGVRITRGGFSRWGSDAFLSDQRLTFVPSIRVNNAIRVHGVYTVGGLRHKYAQRTFDARGELAAGAPPYERYYMHHSSDSAYNTAAIGSWEQVRATIQLPLGVLSIGIKDFPFGTGAIFSENVRTDSFLAVVPYGPFRFLFAVWPGMGARPAGVYRNSGTSFETRPDNGTKFTYRYGPLVTYENGPLWMGGGAILGSYHHDRAFVFSPTGVNLPYGVDVNDALWAASVKYNNGRFFLNADYGFQLIDSYKIKVQNMPAGFVLQDFNPLYNERYVFFGEAGVLAGPAKISLVYSSVSGPVLNNFGALANNDYRQVKTYGGNSLNYQPLRPYNFLMFETYAGGNNLYNPDGTGQMGDAYALAGRLDYATAANLNIWGSFIWAHRLEKAGTYAGQYSATSNFGIYGAAINPDLTVWTPQQWINHAQNFKGGGANTNPYVDDGFIGWEAQAGVSWKLLEGLTMDFAYSYWRLGEWFDQAYAAFTVDGANGGGLNGAQGLGIQKGRDAIQSLRGSFTINF